MSRITRRAASTAARSRTDGSPRAVDRPLAPTSVVAAGSLVAGFAVAQATDVRALGGVVLVAGAAWCGRHWLRRRGPVTAGALLVGYVGGFVGSHLLARQIGAWPSVLTVAAAVGAAAWVASDRRGSDRRGLDRQGSDRGLDRQGSDRQDSDPRG